MKKIITLVCYFCLLWNTFAYAEVITDGTVGIAGKTLGTPQSLAGKNFKITEDLGTKIGNNLFHSFHVFNINAGESATFTSTQAFSNVISRVTGGRASTINGVLESRIPKANFYFINPAGVIFGAGAEINVPAAFHVSTADKLNFTDGKAFYADPTNAQSSFSVAPVASFGFLGTSPHNNGLIQLNGTQLNPNDGTNTTPQTVDLVAGNITVKNNAILLAPAGEIRLVVIKGNNEVSLERDANGFLPLPTQKPNLDNAGTITLNSGNLDTVGNGGGRIALWGGKTSFTNSTAFADNNGNKDAAVGKNLEIQAHTLNVKEHSYLSFDALAGKGNAGNVIVKVEDFLNIENNGFIKSSTYAGGNAGNVSVSADILTINRKSEAPNWTTGIFSEADSDSTGNSGNVNVNAKNIKILNGGGIKSSTLATGNAGNVKVTAADSLTINNGGSPVLGGIYSLNSGDNPGNSGNVTVKAGKLDILNGGVVLSSTYGQGNAGSVTITADNLKIDNQANVIGATGIFSNAELDSSGHAGVVTVNVNKLDIFNGGLISSSTYALGDANTVQVTTQTLNIDGQNNSSSLTGIISNADEGSSGQAGSVVVNAKQTTNIVNGGEISSSAFSRGKAGNVSVITDSLNIDSRGFSEWGTGVFSQANPDSSGKVGNVSVNANSNINLSNNGTISIANYGTTDNPSAVNPGILTVTAPTINMQDSNITTQATENVDASNIKLNFSDKLTANSSFITTEANNGNGGVITINGGKLIYLQNSGFKTSVSGANSNGGNINITADVLVMDTGLIQANAIGGSGGDISLDLKSLIPSQNRLIVGGHKINWQPSPSGLNVIQAASETGVSGTINVTSPQFDISGSLSGLNTSDLVLPNLTDNPCTTQTRLNSSLIRGSKGGIPSNETTSSFIPPTLKNSDDARFNPALPNQKSSPDKAKPKENTSCAPASFQ